MAREERIQNKQPCKGFCLSLHTAGSRPSLCSQHSASTDRKPDSHTGNYPFPPEHRHRHVTFRQLESCTAAGVTADLFYPDDNIVWGIYFYSLRPLQAAQALSEATLSCLQDDLCHVPLRDRHSPFRRLYARTANERKACPLGEAMKKLSFSITAAVMIISLIVMGGILRGILLKLTKTELL